MSTHIQNTKKNVLLKKTTQERYEIVMWISEQPTYMFCYTSKTENEVGPAPLVIHY